MSSECRSAVVASCSISCSACHWLFHSLSSWFLSQTSGKVSWIAIAGITSPPMSLPGVRVATVIAQTTPDLKSSTGPPDIPGEISQLVIRHTLSVAKSCGPSSLQDIA